MTDDRRKHSRVKEVVAIASSVLSLIVSLFVLRIFLATPIKSEAEIRAALMESKEARDKYIPMIERHDRDIEVIQKTNEIQFKTIINTLESMDAKLDRKLDR